ncbi:MAG: GGDEF domain-containing protein [Actinomycetota bacterium]|nr:GGDEF domain-containing protein [Actinomycetota bacterium]
MKHVFQRMGGPVWTMLLWCSLDIATTIAQVVGVPIGNPDRVSYIVIDLAIIVILLIWRASTPTWFLRVVVLTQLAVILHSSAQEATPVGMLAEASVSIIAVLYCGMWWRGWFTYAVAGLGSAGYLAVMHLNGVMGSQAEPWFILTVMLFGVAFGLSLVVGEVTRAATHDSLTGLLNRHGLSEYRRIRPRPGRATLPSTLISIDLDGLKAINDSHGHQAGDRLLRDFGSVLRHGLRPDDLAVRMGGDEFLVILAQTAPSATGTLVSRLREQSPGPWSCGVVEWTTDEPFEAALGRADALLYEDKRFRRARVTASVT